MSDVSGIPYMGPMGQGNFFAPQFSYNPQINPTAGYAAPAAYAQNEFSNLTNNLRASQQYTANLITSAAMAMPNSPQGAYMFSDTGGPASRGGGSIFDQGAINNFITSGGGYSFPSIPDYTSGRGGGPSIDWTTLFQSPSTNYGTFQGGGSRAADPYPGMAMPGGLGAPMTAPSQAPSQAPAQAPALDWSKIQSPTTNYNTFQGGGGAGSQDISAIPMPSSKKLLGYEPATFPAKAQDQPALDLGGGTAGWSNAPAPMPSSKALLGYEPQQNRDQAVDWSLFQSPATSYDTFQGGGTAPGQQADASGGLTSGGGLTASELGAKARDQLAKIMTPGEKATEAPAPADERARLPVAPPAEAPTDPYAALPGKVPLPQERPAAADVPRPPADIPGRADMSIPGKVDILRNTLRKELEAQDLVMTSDYRGPEHELYRPGSAHGQGLAFDARARTPEQADAAMNKIRELFAARGMVEGKNADYFFIDEVRHPILGITRGAHLHTTLTPEGMQKYQERAFMDPYPNAPPRPPEDIPNAAAPFPARPEGPVPQEANPPRPPGDIPPVSPSSDYSTFQKSASVAPPRPPADIPAAPKHSGLELARANIDTPIERIAMERGGQKAVDQISSMAIGKTPRELMQSYGGLFMSRAEPMFQSLGITRQDFEKAISMPPTRQDLKMRFGGDFGALGGELPTAGSFSPYPGFRQSTNIEDRSGEQLGREQLAALQARGPGYFPEDLPDTAAPTPLGNALGLGDVERGMGSRVGFPSTGADPFKDIESQIRDMLARPQGLAGDAAAAPLPFIDPQTGEWKGEAYTIPPLGTYSDWRQSPNIDDRREEQYQGLAGRLWDKAKYALQEDKAIVNDWFAKPADTNNPLSAGLGISDLTAEKQWPTETSPAAQSPANDYTTFQAPGSAGAASPAFDFQSPAADYDTFQQGRADLAAQMAAPGATMDFSGFSRTPEPSQRAAPGGVGPEMEPPTPEFMQTIAEAESSFDPNKHNKGSQYKGMYQLNEPEFRKYGGTGSIYDQDQNSFAAMAKMTAEGQTAQNVLGRALTPVEQYMVHQQGLYGTLSHLQNPDQPAWKNFQQASKWNDADAKEAIWGNLTKAMQAQFGKVENITSRDFINMWGDRYNALQKGLGLQ